MGGCSITMVHPSKHSTTVQTIAPPPLELSTTALYAGTTAAFVCAGLALCLGSSYIACTLPFHLVVFQAVCSDDHYKYLLPLLLPTTAWFVIANWVGWEYFRNA